MDVVYALSLCIRLKKELTELFAREGLQGPMGKDEFYGVMGRKDLNGCKFHEQFGYSRRRVPKRSWWKTLSVSTLESGVEISSIAA